jgi:hypothetical protein
MSGKGEKDRSFNLGSVIARGLASDAREYGVKNQSDGFEKGGDNRRNANAIVHAEPGQARNHVVSAVKLAYNARK